FQDTAHSGDVRPLIDLTDLCDRLGEARDERIRNVAADLRRTLEPGKGLIVEHRRDANFDGLNGLGIYAPAITNAADLERLELDQESYGRLALVAARNNKWKDLVFEDLQQLLEPTRTDIANFVSGTGAASPEDVAAVGQLTAGVFRAFERLE